ncbi:uncharacterized protein LOC122532342 [Frieseomelitta varia]|uniref:uncharacterized protein LOC122532342 n=1 Tax=Frieseomelitta varia TaxID=561572 RepID=UPI001CB68165|nr:uncharacterized protein LOC122532342 [Frieseomelitta varia]XP_043516984.1 uncharacterized protein LOC122532342 [Frieseomelitta varia]XP_043516985.1 uncharacterized protein LOC122532342 [Frieseomelitta varia]
MENEQRHYELRSGSRSRSRTPLVQSSTTTIEPETLEHHYHLRNLSRERSHTPGEIANVKRPGRILSGSSSKTNDQNVGTITETEKEIVTVDTTLGNKSKHIENSSFYMKKGERRSERQKAKKKIFANGQNDNKEDSLINKSEKDDKSIFLHRTFTSDYSSEETEQEDTPHKPCSAHEIYKQAGDWWDVFPKTDYTYSEKSKCRYEIAPGILAMPNMSRRSIHSNTENSNQFLYTPSKNDICETTNIEKEKQTKTENSTLNEFYGSHTPKLDKSKVQYTKTHVEQYYRHREVIYAEPSSLTNSRSRQLLHSDLSLKRMNSRKCGITSAIDSDVELEETISKNYNQRNKIVQRFMSFVSIIVLWFIKFLEFLKLKTVKRREYYATYEYESKYSKIWKYVDHCLQYIYLFMVRVFFFDSWLLSHVSSTRRWIHQRSPKMFWVALLPLLLLTGWWCLLHYSTLFPLTKVITQQFGVGQKLNPSDKPLFLKWEMFRKEDNFESITEKLHSRISNLEDRSIEQSDRLFNITQSLEQLREKGYVWSKYDNEILLLEKRMKEYKLDNIYSQEINIIKSQLERLKEFYSELKSCCNTHTNHISSEDLEKRIQIVFTDYFDTLMSKREKVQDKSWIVNDNVVTDDRVREIVKEAIKIYDADKTGRVDYALESAGGQIISTRCTQRYDTKTRVVKLLAFTLYHENNNPRTVIQGNPIQPGACWAFQGFPGYLLIKLRSSIYVTGFTVEHAPKSILPNEEMRSAPKKFNVWGFVDENDSEPVLFGDYEFAATDDSLQYFPVKNTTIKTPYEYVELRIHSNHGQLEYTCLYRFRVHGKSV